MFAGRRARRYLNPTTTGNDAITAARVAESLAERAACVLDQAVQTKNFEFARPRGCALLESSFTCRLPRLKQAISDNTPDPEIHFRGDQTRRELIERRGVLQGPPRKCLLAGLKLNERLLERLANRAREFVGRAFRAPLSTGASLCHSRSIALSAQKQQAGLPHRACPLDVTTDFLSRGARHAELLSEPPVAEVLGVSTRMFLVQRAHQFNLVVGQHHGLFFPVVAVSYNLQFFTG